MWCGSRKKEGSSGKVGEATCGEGGRFQRSGVVAKKKRKTKQKKSANLER